MPKRTLRMVAAIGVVASGCGAPPRHDPYTAVSHGPPDAAPAPIAPAAFLPRSAPMAVSRSAPLHPATTTTVPMVTTTTRARPEWPVRPVVGTALASWYDTPWAGTRPYTFASRTIPRGTWVTFTYHGRSVRAVCWDYGPASWTGRTFDLSRAAFAALASTGSGVIGVGWSFG